MGMELLVKYQGQAYFFLLAFLTIVFYWYIFHLYWSEKTGRKNYEKYGDIALKDEINDEPVETMPVNKSIKMNKGEQR